MDLTGSRTPRVPITSSKRFAARSVSDTVSSASVLGEKSKFVVDRPAFMGDSVATLRSVGDTHVGPVGLDWERKEGNDE